jgi:peptidoglycan/xylan/chitin deacetylase (PgdA/CDA1 family)
LERYAAKATFFMVGEVAERYPHLVKMVATQGHAVANHSMTHAAFPLLSSRARQAEIKACEETLRPYAVKLFRPPFGLENFFCHRDACRLGYRVVKWSASVDDWRDHSPTWIAEKIQSQLKPGSIVLLHDNRIDDVHGNQGQTVEALERVLSSAKDFQFRTLPQLMEMGRPMTSFDPVW